MSSSHKVCRTGSSWSALALAALCGCGSAEPYDYESAEREPTAVVESAPPLVAIPDARGAFLPLPVQPLDAALYESASYLEALSALGAGDAQAAAVLLGDAERAEGSHPDRLKLHAYALLADGRPAEAERVLHAVVSDDAGLQLLRADAHYQMGDADAAISGYRAAARNFPQNAEVLERAARCAVDAGEGAFAVECLDQLVLTGQQPADVMYLRAQAQSAVGDFPAALAVYDKLIAEQPDNRELLEEAGHLAFRAALAQTLNIDYERAVRYFSSAIELDPQDSRLHYNLGCALDWSEQFDGAEVAYMRSLELDPGALNTAENLAELYARSGRQAEALRVLEQSLRQPLTAEEVDRVMLRRQRIESGAPLDGHPLPE